MTQEPAAQSSRCMPGAFLRGRATWQDPDPSSGLPDLGPALQALSERGPAVGVPACMNPPDLFEATARFPVGQRCVEGLVTVRDERDLVRALAVLPFKEFEFHGLPGKRRAVDRLRYSITFRSNVDRGRRGG